MMCGHPFCQVHDIIQCNLREAPDQRSVLQYKACPQPTNSTWWWQRGPSSTLFWTLGTQTNDSAVILKHSCSALRLWNILSHVHMCKVKHLSCGGDVCLQPSCKCLIHLNDSLQWTREAFWYKLVKKQQMLYMILYMFLYLSQGQISKYLLH